MHSHWSLDQPPDEVNKPLYVDRDKRLLKL
jgi:hypothetical protein